MNLKPIPQGWHEEVYVDLNSHLWDYEPETRDAACSAVGAALSQFPFMGL